MDVKFLWLWSFNSTFHVFLLNPTANILICKIMRSCQSIKDECNLPFFTFSIPAHAKRIKKKKKKRQCRRMSWCSWIVTMKLQKLYHIATNKNIAVHASTQFVRPTEFWRFINISMRKTAKIWVLFLLGYVIFIIENILFSCRQVHISISPSAHIKGLSVYYLTI